MTEINNPRITSGLRAVAVLVVLAMMALIAPSSRSAVAADRPNATTLENFAENAERLSPAEASDYAVAAQLPTTSRSGLAVDTTNPQAWRLEDGFIYVSYPLLGTGAYASNLGAILSADGTVGERTELAMVGGTDAGTVRMWRDGSLVIDQSVTTPTTDQQRAAAADSFWSRLNNCLSSAGIPAWVVTGVSIVCAAVCVGTLGAGCVACIAAAAGVAGGTAGYCVDQAAG